MKITKNYLRQLIKEELDNNETTGEFPVVTIKAYAKLDTSRNKKTRIDAEEDISYASKVINAINTKLENGVAPYKFDKVYDEDTYNKILEDEGYRSYSVEVDPNNFTTRKLNGAIVAFGYPDTLSEFIRKKIAEAMRQKGMQVDYI